MNLDGYNRSTREFLEKYGEIPIVSLSVVIVPVPFIIPLLLNVLTKREFNKFMKTAITYYNTYYCINSATD